jgi:hypothetical protein
MTVMAGNNPVSGTATDTFAPLFVERNRNMLPARSAIGEQAGAA